MKKINAGALEWEAYFSPKRAFGGYGKPLSGALGRKPESTDLLERHPFDVEIQRIPAGMPATVYHSHSAQWEFYHVVSGNGTVRHADGVDPIGPGDTFIFKPGEAHQLHGGESEDLIVLVVADNPIGESVYYHDSDKHLVREPQRMLLRSESLDYWDGEE
jgi:uncharacterized cupin superfamily protein